MGRPKKRPPEVTPDNLAEGLGADEHTKLRGKIPNSFSEVLIQQLKPSIRTRLAKRLIEIGIEGRDKEALAAIKEIADRVEGRVRQTELPAREGGDTLLELLKAAYSDDAKLYTDATYEVLPADFKELREEDIPASGD